jgi:hypothetical protein
LVPGSHSASVAMASAARVARAAPNQIAPSAGSGAGSGGPGPVPGPGLGPVPAAIPAAVPQAAPALPAAEAIGSEFVAQYYAAMHARLDQLHRFYAEDSSLFVAGPSGVAPSPVAATGLHAIDDALRRLAARRARVTVTSVDALHSAHGAVVVVVTGRAEGPTGPVKSHRFTQTFVLAPQRGGFYVKNDLVRFLAEPHEPGLFPTNVPSATPPTQTNVANENAPSPREPATNKNPGAAAVSAPPAGESQSLEAIEAKLAAAARVTNASRGSDGEEATREDKEAREDKETTTRKNPNTGKEPKPKEEPQTGPPSYATALLKARAAAAAANSGGDGFAKLRKPPVGSGGSGGSPSGSLGLPSGLDKEVSTRETRSHAIFVRHFPPATTESDLRLVFESFGAVAEDGVTLRASKTQKSETTIEKHAFIEFVDKKGFDEALRFAATKEVLVLGAAVGVEEKREKPPARRDRGDGTNKSGADERGAEAHRREARGGDRERRAPRKNQTGGARVGGREGEAGRREGGAGRARGRVDKR